MGFKNPEVNGDFEVNLDERVSGFRAKNSSLASGQRSAVFLLVSLFSFRLNYMISRTSPTQSSLIGTVL